MECDPKIRVVDDRLKICTARSAARSISRSCSPGRIMMTGSWATRHAGYHINSNDTMIKGRRISSTLRRICNCRSIRGASSARHNNNNHLIGLIGLSKSGYYRPACCNHRKEHQNPYRQLDHLDPHKIVTLLPHKYTATHVSLRHGACQLAWGG